jgi:hypothetical protein
MGFDSDPAEVEPVRVPARLYGHVGFGRPVAVVTARKGQQRGLLARDAGYLSADLLNQSSRARSVRQVMAVVFAFAIVQKGEELNDARARGSAFGKGEAVSTHARPMPCAVDTVPVEREPRPQEFNEGWA